MTDLKVLNLDVPDDTTDETSFVVTWENPSTVSFIDEYQLILVSNGQNESLFGIDKTNTNYTISNRVPGRTYTIILRSVDSQTRPTQQTTDVNITDGTSKFSNFSIKFVYVKNMLKKLLQIYIGYYKHTAFN